MSKTKKTETLVDCPACGRTGFTARGLKAHKCKGPSEAESIPPAVAIESIAFQDEPHLECYEQIDIPGHPGYAVILSQRKENHWYHFGWKTPTGWVCPTIDRQGCLIRIRAIQYALEYMSVGWAENDRKKLRKLDIKISGSDPKPVDMEVIPPTGKVVSREQALREMGVTPVEPEQPLAVAVPERRPAPKRLIDQYGGTDVVVPDGTPQLTIFSDQEAASKVRQLVSDAQDGLRRIIVCGLYLETIKNDLPHGQFYRWLDAYCPDISRRTVSGWMTLAANMREVCGVKSATVAYLSTPIYEAISLLPEDRPEDVRDVCAKMDELMSGKSARQLLLEFKQAEEDADGHLVARRGRLPGSKQDRKRKGIQEGLEEAAAESEEFLKTLKGDLYLAATGNGITQIDRDLLEALLHNAVELTTRIRAILKGH